MPSKGPIDVRRIVGNILTLGNPLAGVRQSFLVPSVSQNMALGSKQFVDEAVYRYCKNGGVQLAAGVVVQSPLPDALQLGLALVSSTLVGATSFTITLGNSPVTLNQYAGGYLSVDGGTGAQGLGVRLRILSHPAANALANVVITTIDAAPIAFTAGASTFQLSMNPYNLVIVTPASPPTAKVLGVSPVIVPINYYFWLITKGPAIVKNTTGVPLSGTLAVASLTAAGTFDEAIADDHATSPLGRVIRTGINTAWCLIDVQCE